MAKIYANLIKNHTINPKTGKEWCIEDVPDKLKEAVQKILDEG